MMRRFKKILLLSCIGTWGLLAVSCAGSSTRGAVGTSTGNPTYFPANLAIASPFDASEEGSGAVALSLAQTTRPLGRFRPAYQDATESIRERLEGTADDDCHFSPRFFLTREIDAGCYGPPIAYESHPDAQGPNDPRASSTLPPGDLGLWTETDTLSGHACAAAEVNARLKTLHDRSLGALTGLASLICVANVNGIALPSDNSVDLTLPMNALEIPGVSFREATIVHTTTETGDQWSYDLEFDFTRDADSFVIRAELVHLPGSADGLYRGRLSTRVNDTVNISGNCQTREQTLASSLLYNRTAADDLSVEVRGGHFCGHDADAFTDGLVDPAKKFDPQNTPNGWANDFDIFTATFDPDTLEGNYTYAWQAGMGDGYTRVLNSAVATDAESGNLEADAFYGFGNDIAATDGGIIGFFCNWAGPGGSFDKAANLQELAQHQSMTFNTETGKFDAATSNISYAPVHSCDYDGTGNFRFDSDGDGVIDTDPATAITNDLVPLIDADGNGTFDELTESGFLLPLPPENF